MIAQAIKGWLQKMFAWWPWKKSTPLEYQHVASAVNSGPASETPSWISKEGTIPQADMAPRRLTFESRAERLVQPHPEAPDLPPLSPSSACKKAGTGTAGDCAEGAPATPTPHQRLEFLRYLVQRGIVNEGTEND